MKAIIEMPKGTSAKSEIDKKTGVLFVDRYLKVSVPCNYGFLKDTLAEDGDALDVFVLGNRLEGLAELEVIPSGVFICMDQGVWDHKIVGTPYEDRISSEERAAAVQEIGKYLASYKEGFDVRAYTEDILIIMRVLRNARLHRNKPVFEHETLGWRRFVALLGLAGLLALLSKFWR